MHATQNHELPSFFGYLRKVFHFREAVARLGDGRQDPDISPQTVFLSLFHGFVFRLSSFLQLEADLAQPHLQHCTEAPGAFGNDVLRYSLASFTLEPLEQMLVNINRRLKRNKALDPGRVQGRVVAALDGIEVLSSFSRCCEFCLQRRVVSLDEQGQPVEQIQYYHRLVGCQVVSSPVKPILALEWVRPNEGEDTAALRLLHRLPEVYGSRFFDILLLDSLYAQTPVLQLAKEIDWDLVITLKQENRTLYQDAMACFKAAHPTINSPKSMATTLLKHNSGRPRSFPSPRSIRNRCGWCARKSEKQNGTTDRESVSRRPSSRNGCGLQR